MEHYKNNPDLMQSTSTAMLGESYEGIDGDFL
jgi:hypothetical protein